MKENIFSYSQKKRELKQEKKESLAFERNGKEIYLPTYIPIITNITISSNVIGA